MMRAIAFLVLIMGASCAGASNERERRSVPSLADGSYVGFVRALGNGRAGATMSFDRAEFLTGDEATRAAAAHGAEVPVPNDYYIDNDDRTIIELPIAPDAAFTVQGEDGQGGDPADLHTVDTTRFEGLFGANTAYFMSVPYRVSVRGGVVVKVEQVYVP